MKKPHIEEVSQKVRSAMRSSAGKNLMLYLLFVLVAFAFWMMLSLESEVQKDYEVPLQVENVPDSVTMITDVPHSVTVSVRAKGGQLIRYSWGSPPTLKIDYRAYVLNPSSENPRIYLSRSKLDARLRDYFGTGVIIASVKPDSLSLQCTTSPGTKVKLNVVADVKTALQCILSGPIRANVDSVTVYSSNRLPAELHTIETEPLIRSDLKDSVTFELRVRPVAGMKIIPSTVKVLVPVEPLISKKSSVVVECPNVPHGERLLTFPSKVEVSYLVPLSSFSHDYPLRVTVDYNDTKQPGDKVPVRLGPLPPDFHNPSVSPDSVEYLIERNS